MQFRIRSILRISILRISLAVILLAVMSGAVARRLTPLLPGLCDRHGESYTSSPCDLLITIYLSGHAEHLRLSD